MIKKGIQDVLFKCVVVIVLLHTCIPHRHREEMSEKAHIKLHQNNNSLIGILKIVFHEGYDEYLDNLFFAKNNYDVSLHHFCKQHPNKSGSEAIEKCTNGVQLLNKPNNYTYSNIFIVKLNGLRAPPATPYS